MKDTALWLREMVRRLLAEGTVTWFIGYGKGRDPYHPMPLFVDRAEQVERLIWDPFCIHGLAKYAMQFPLVPGKIGLVAKGCDSLALERLFADNRLARERVYVVGVGCPGMLDSDRVALRGWGPVEAVRHDGDNLVLVTSRSEMTVPRAEYLAVKCRDCDVPNPVVHDELHGEVAPWHEDGKDFSEVEELEGLSPEEKAAYWARQFQRCLRCYACRQVCPACNCRWCCFDDRVPRWLGRGTDVGEQEMFHFTRAFHVAGRCVDCGECDRVCPVNIPLRKLNRKFMKDVAELFQVEKPYVPVAVEPLGQFHPEDPDHFE